MRSRISRTAVFLLIVVISATLIGHLVQSRTPNIVFISMDTFRADRMRAYGGSGLTPTLDALAEKATVFSRALVSSGTTYPSHATMFTGLYPRMHAVRNNFSKLPEDVSTLAERLSSAGYDTGAFVSFMAMLVRGNLGKGFDALSDTELLGSEIFRDGSQTARMALDWLDSREDRRKPVFLWYHNFDAHLPLRLTPYAERRLEALGYQGPWRDGASVEEVTSSQREIRTSRKLQLAIEALYDGEVRNADNAVKLLLDGLKARGVLQNAIVVLVADHGEALGENGWFGHGPILWETVIRTPLAIVDYRDPRHRIIDTTVGTVDLMASLLEIAGQDPGPSLGRSLVPALKGNALDSAEYVVEVELRKEDRRPSWYDADRLAVYYDDFKLEYAFGEGQLFDLRRDRNAVRPLNPISPNDALIKTIGDYLEGIAQEYVAGGMAANLPAMDEETVNQLKSLGYVQ